MYPSPIYSEIEMGGVVVVPATVAVNVSNTLYAPRFVPSTLLIKWCLGSQATTSTTSCCNQAKFECS